MIKGSVMQKTKDRDERALQWIRRCVEQQGRFPSVRQLQQAMGLSSTSQAAALLTRLEQQGHIERDGRYRKLAGAVGSIPVAVLGTIAAGAPLLAAEQIEGYLPVDPALARGRSLFALKVRGESMINAGILPADIVLLEQTATVENGEIAAVLLEEEATLKRVYREKGGIRLQPENDAMEPIFTQDCQILGRLIGLTRSYE